MRFFRTRKANKHKADTEHPYYNANTAIPAKQPVCPAPPTSRPATSPTSTPHAPDGFQRLPSAPRVEDPFVARVPSTAASVTTGSPNTPYQAAIAAFEAVNSNNNSNHQHYHHPLQRTTSAHKDSSDPPSPPPSAYITPSMDAGLYHPPKKDNSDFTRKYSRKTPKLLLDFFFAAIAWLLAPVLLVVTVVVGIPLLFFIAVITEVVSTCLCSDRLRFPIRAPEPMQALETCMAQEYGIDIQHVSEQFVFSSNHASYSADARAFLVPCQRQHRLSRTLVFLHSYADTAMEALPIADALAETFTVIAIHLPGFGRSFVTPEPPSADAYAVCVADFIEAFLYHAAITDRVLVVGHGYGAVPALAFVERHRKRVSGLTLLSPSCVFPSFGRNGAARALALKLRLPYMVRYVGPVFAWAILSFGWVSQRDAAFYYYYSILSNRSAISAAKYMPQSIAVGFTGAHYSTPVFFALTRLILAGFPIWTVYARDDPTAVDGRILESVLGIPCTVAEGSPRRLIACENANAIVEAVSSIGRLKGGEYTTILAPPECLPSPEWFASTFTPFDGTQKAETMGEAYAACFH